MKKLLFVILVLGMASVAKAVIIEVESGKGRQTPTIVTVISEDTSNWLGYIIIKEGDSGALSNGFCTEMAGDPQLAGIIPYTEAGWGTGYELTVAGTASNPVGIGTLFTMDYSFTGIWTRISPISLYIDPEYEVPATSFWPFYYPESMTLNLQLEGEWPLPPDTPATITVLSEDTRNWLGYIIIEEGGSGELSNPIVLDAAGAQARAVVYEEAGWGAGFELIQDDYPHAAPGPQFSFDYSYSGDLAADTTISLYIDPYYEVPVAQLIIPEPMTVVLLGLGGLFLRRRK
jgi:RNA polymerase subunit RPABC4/transcription elongation factor Spt4